MIRRPGVLPEGGIRVIPGQQRRGNMNSRLLDGACDPYVVSKHPQAPADLLICIAAAQSGVVSCVFEHLPTGATREPRMDSGRHYLEWKSCDSLESGQAGQAETTRGFKLSRMVERLSQMKKQLFPGVVDSRDLGTQGAICVPGRSMNGECGYSSYLLTVSRRGASWWGERPHRPY